MTNKLELSKDEITLILTKREEDKAKGLLKQKAYQGAVERAFAEEKSILAKTLKENEDLVNAYEDVYNRLSKIAPHFTLNIKPYKVKRNVEVYKYDEDGNVIYRDKDDNHTRHNVGAVEETLKSCSIIFNGETVKDKEYRVKVERRGVGRLGVVKITKITLDGSGFEYNETGRSYTKLETVNNKIVERVASDMDRAKREREQRDLEIRAVELATKKYPFEVRATKNNSRGHSQDVIRVVLPNEIEIDLNYREVDGEIEFTVYKVEYLYNVSVDALIGALGILGKK